MGINHPQSHSSTHKATGQPVRSNVGKVVGIVVGETFAKTVHSMRHMLNNPPGWAFDVASIEQAKAYGARRIRLSDKDTDTVFETDFATFDRYAFDLNRGYGRQRRCRWNVGKHMSPTNPDRGCCGNAATPASYSPAA